MNMIQIHNYADNQCIYAYICTSCVQFKMIKAAIYKLSGKYIYYVEQYNNN